MPWKSASGGTDSHNMNSMQFSCRWLNHLTEHQSSCDEKDSLSPQIAVSLSMTLTDTTRCCILTFITERAISCSWNCMQCLLRGEQWYAMQEAHLQTAHKYAMPWEDACEAVNMSVKVEAHSCSWITSLSDTVHSVQHIPVSLLSNMRPISHAGFAGRLQHVNVQLPGGIYSLLSKDTVHALAIL